MSKKIAKILGGLAAVGAAAAGIFYWYKKKNSDDDFEDEFNEDFEAEEFELDEDLKEVSDRGYTTLTPAAEPTDEIVAEECNCTEEYSQEEDKNIECNCESKEKAE